MDSLDISFFIALSNVENSVRKGYNSELNLWFPHESVEGGNQTIAYGHKLTQKEKSSGEFKNGIDQFDAINLLVEDFNIAWNRVEKDWDSSFIEKFYTLPKEYQYVLAELCFNVGSLARGGDWKWPKLAKAIRNGNDQGVYENAQRFYTDSNNKKKRLTKRVITIHRALGLKFTPFNDTN